MRTKHLFWILSGILYLAIAVLLLYGFKAQPWMLLLSQLVLLLLLILLIYFYRIIIKPISIITGGADLIKEQDFSSRLAKIGQPDIDKLIEVFNQMMGQLKDERIKVREQHYFLDLLINASPMGVIILDFEGCISTINPAAQKLFQNSVKQGLPLKMIQHPLATEMVTLSPNEQRIVRINGLHSYKCTRSYFIDRGFQHPFLLVEELTNELLKTEKQAYEKVIRMMSHEVNNAIGATNSMLTLLSENLRSTGLSYSDEFCKVIDIATERGYKLNHLMSNFADVVKIPQPDRKEISINSIIDSVKLLIEAQCRKNSIDLQIELPQASAIIYADIIQMEQVVINIVKNSIEAINGSGRIDIIGSSTPRSLAIIDNGKGIKPDEKQLLFTPFYSTKPNGQGIGLMFIREILINHGFQFSLETVQGKTTFKIQF
jgi:Signal transduction histidine kinase involved in nitrogen fixation and metabolism regulation